MLKHDYTAKILNLEDVIIKNVECNLDELHFYLELPVSEHTCPNCGCTTSFDQSLQTNLRITLDGTQTSP